MTDSISFRKQALRSLTNEIGVYVICDLDNVPIYVGQSTDGIRARVNRHLTSARSDIIANRQIDVWEIAWVMAYPQSDRALLNELEAVVFHHFNEKSTLMNGAIPQRPEGALSIPEPSQIVQVMSDEDIRERLDPALRLPRQAEHYSQIVGHFLVVKNSIQIARSMQAHFERLSRYHASLLGSASSDEDPGEA